MIIFRSVLNSMDLCESSPPFSKLPEDIELEILSLLPFESLPTIKSVSKRWNDLLLHPIEHFFLRHSRAHANPKLYLFTRCLDPYENVKYCVVLYGYFLSAELPSYSGCKEEDTARKTKVTKRACRVALPRSPFVMSNICNGLVCFYTEFGCVDPPMYLYSLRAQIRIRISSSLSRDELKRGDYDYWKTFGCFLGFDATSNEYKVLRHRMKSNYYVYDILNLGSSSSNSWVPITNELVPAAIRKGRPRVATCYVDGVVYWLHDTSDFAKFPILAAYDFSHGRFRVFDIGRLFGSSSDKSIKSDLTIRKGCPNLVLWEYSDNKRRRFRMENHTTSSSKNVKWRISEISSPLSNNFSLYVGGIVVDREGKHVLPSTLMFKCYDLENGTTWDIEAEALSDQWYIHDFVFRVFLDKN